MRTVPSWCVGGAAIAAAVVVIAVAGLEPQGEPRPAKTSGARATLRDRILGVLDEPGLADLDRIRRIQELLEREEAALQIDADEAIARLEAAGARLIRGPDGEVRSLLASGNTLSDAELALLVSFPIKSLMVSGEGITDAGMESISKLKGLSSLTILGSSITDKGLKNLTALERLRSVSLGDGSYTSAGVKSISDTLGLRSVSLHRTDLSDEELRSFADAPLRMFGIRSDRLTDEQVRILNEFTGPKSLSLHLTHVSDSDLRAAGQLASEISSLRVSDSPAVTDSGIAHLPHLKVRSLSLRGTQVTDDGLQHLEGMVSLELLDIDGPQITDAAIEHLTELPGLQFLSVRNTSVSDDGVKRLTEAIPHLRVQK